MVPLRDLSRDAIAPQLARSPRDELVADAKACGSLKGLKLQFQEFGQIVQSEANQRIARYAAAFSASASVISLAPSFLTLAKSCPHIHDPSFRASCGVSAASVFGAFLGFTGVAMSAYALYAGKKSVFKFIFKRDGELKNRFALHLGNAPERAAKLMTRYGQPSAFDRDFVKDHLFQLYLNNPKPVRAEPPAGEPGLEIEIDRG